MVLGFQQRKEQSENLRLKLEVSEASLLKRRFRTKDRMKMKPVQLNSIQIMTF